MWKGVHFVCEREWNYVILFISDKKDVKESEPGLKTCVIVKKDVWECLMIYVLAICLDSPELQKGNESLLTAKHSLPNECMCQMHRGIPLKLLWMYVGKLIERKIEICLECYVKDSVSTDDQNRIKTEWWDISLKSCRVLGLAIVWVKFEYLPEIVLR